MARVWISLLRHKLGQGEHCALAPGFHGVFALEGAVEQAGQVIERGDGKFTSDGEVVATAPSELLDFAVTSEPVEGAELSQSVTWSDAEPFLRLDQVEFPPGARAYRHTHPGPGIRVLTAGVLEIRSDHHTEMMAPGSAWFEDANSPVQATAGEMQTCFVRAMLLPMDYLGKPTLTILDPADAALPRLQKNKRFFDHVLRLPSG